MGMPRAGNHTAAASSLFTCHHSVAPRVRSGCRGGGAQAGMAHDARLVALQQRQGEIVRHGDPNAGCHTSLDAHAEASS